MLRQSLTHCASSAAAGVGHLQLGGRSLKLRSLKGRRAHNSQHSQHSAQRHRANNRLKWRTMISRVVISQVMISMAWQMRCMMSCRRLSLVPTARLRNKKMSK
jgi:hypothetical protein